MTLAIVGLAFIVQGLPSNIKDRRGLREQDRQKASALKKVFVAFKTAAEKTHPELKSQETGGQKTNLGVLKAFQKAMATSALLTKEPTQRRVHGKKITSQLKTGFSTLQDEKAIITRDEVLLEWGYLDENGVFISYETLEPKEIPIEEVEKYLVEDVDEEIYVSDEFWEDPEFFPSLNLIDFDDETFRMSISSEVGIPYFTV